ncbi:hypothetical protein BA894_11450 [Vibrio natriegens]|nr:hypothetical protein BA894_11450 [Vibrio natriegens]
MLRSGVRLCLLEFYILEIIHEVLKFDSTKLDFVQGLLSSIIANKSLPHSKLRLINALIQKAAFWITFIHFWSKSETSKN